MIEHDETSHMKYVEARVAYLCDLAMVDETTITADNYTTIRDGLNTYLTGGELRRAKVELRNIIYVLTMIQHLNGSAS
jgi:predicted glycoside hydrolase/deacetylase ChbG (UPF0249 family)